MQGQKELVPKMMYQVHIGDLVPLNNFYRILDKELDLHFLYNLQPEKIHEIRQQKSRYKSNGYASSNKICFFAYSSLFWLSFRPYKLLFSHNENHNQKKQPFVKTVVLKASFYKY